ncbi:hypothetical protein BGW80DRAFT_1315094 [Lactifluus volemus]|nr:hypothetical protein BGW80DRAFT_1315094 [Lactifluus volemus]
MIRGDGHEGHVIFDRFSWNLQPHFVYRTSPSRPPFAYLVSSLHVYFFLHLLYVCFVLRAFRFPVWLYVYLCSFRKVFSVRCVFPSSFWPSTASPRILVLYFCFLSFLDLMPVRVTYSSGGSDSQNQGCQYRPEPASVSIGYHLIQVSIRWPVLYWPRRSKK